MRRGWKIGIIIVLALLIGIIFLIYKEHKDSPQTNYDLITIKHLEAFDSSEGQLSVNSLKGDFQWESTSYQYTNGIGRIYGNWCNGNPRFENCVTASMPLKVKESNLDKVTKNTCESIKYGLDNEFNSHQNSSETSIGVSYSIPVKDGDIICLSIDKNRDGTMGDQFTAIKILSHVTSNEGDYADSMTFEYRILE